MPRTAHALESQSSVRVALGFRAHSGWAAIVVVAEQPTIPTVVERSRIDLAGAATPHTVQPYHAARAMQLSEAAVLVQQAAAQARRLAAEAIRKWVDELTRRGFAVVGCGVCLGSNRPAAPLAVTLASHALVHAAEGALFRDALSGAATDCDLPVTAVAERDIVARAATALHIREDRLRHRLAELGRPLGPPWREDEKLATLAACLALTAQHA